MSEESKTRHNRLRKLLLDEKKKMWGELREELFNKLGNEYNTQFDNPHDIEELGLIDIIEDTGIAVADLKRQELERMDESLRMLEDGTYGDCTVCGEEIDEERLKVMPFSNRCQRCQGETEGAKKPTL